MRNKKKIIIMTLFSALLFCMVIVICSMSPLSDMGENANQFNSLGMWLSIAMILVFYLVPLLMYSLGLEWMKYLMAVFCSFGLLIMLSMILLVVLIGAVKGILPSLIGVLVISGINGLINIIWFFTTFSKGSK